MSRTKSNRRVYSLPAAVFALLVALANHAAAQMRTCAPTEEAFWSLADIYGEIPVGSGSSANGYPVHLTVNPETGSWTFVATANGVTCIIAAGYDWNDTPPPLPPRP